MLHITGSMKTLKGELQSAHGFLKDIIGVLEWVQPNDNLTQKVGNFIAKMPEYKVLAKDSANFKQLLRKVCSGEILPSIASDDFTDAKLEIERLLDVLNNSKFF